jgi:hypothetical protein
VSDLPDLDVEQIDERLGELRPLVTEYRRLQAAREALAGLRGSSERSAGEDEGRRAGGSGVDPRPEP